MKRRMIDEILSIVDRAPKDDLANFLKESTVIVADNVSEFYYEIDDRTLWISDLPNIAPPFESMFIEWKPPKFINSNGIIEHQKDDMSIQFFGVQIISVNNSGNIFGLGEKVNWTLSLIPYYMSRGEITRGYNVAVTLVLDESGTVCDERVRVHHLSNENNMSEDEAGVISGNIINQCIPALLAISFMHCKNVELYRPAERQLPKTKKRSNRKNPVRYYTLNIHPMKKILEDSGKYSKSGIKHALHICRGHFKDFSKGNGLFGKYKGLYWWDSQVRGNAQHGVVVKDYKVNPDD